MESLKTDLKDGILVVTKIGAHDLPSPIPMGEWTQKTQEYTSELKRMVQNSHGAQESFKEKVADDEILTIISKTMGKEILGNLEHEMGFKLLSIATNDKWETEITEREEAIGVVELNDPIRIKIVILGEDFLKKKGLPRKLKPERRFAKMRLLKNCTVKDFTEFVVQDFEKLNMEVQVRTAGVGTYDIQTGGLPQFYEDNIRDILLQEGWIISHRGESPILDTLLPPGTGVKGCHFLNKDGSEDHPYWRR